MSLVIDVSAILAVILGEPEKKQIIELTKNKNLVGPGSIQWEIGNAFSAMFKQKRLTLKEAQKGIEIFNKIPIRYLEIDLLNSIKIANKNNIYAYDAYFLDCALKHSLPLLTLDNKMRSAALDLKINSLEV